MSKGTATAPTTGVTSRGYAMIIVLLVLVLMGIAVGSMAAVLDGTIAEGRRTVSTIRTDFACGSALDLAARTIKARLATEPSADPQGLIVELCALGTCDTVAGVVLPRFLAPAGNTLEFFGIFFESSRPTTRAIAAGPFQGRVAVDQTLAVSVVVRDNLTGRQCHATDRYTLPSFPLASFALFGAAPRTVWAPPLSVRRVNDGLPSAAHLNGNKLGAQISAADFVMPAAQFAGDRDAINLITSTRGADAVLAPAVGNPAAPASQASLERSFSWLVQPPVAADSDGLRAARLAEVADIVIVDGVWYYNRNKNAPWPGRPIWSDRPGSTVDHVAPADGIVESTDKVGMGDLGFLPGEFPHRYSWYDRAGVGGGETIRAQTTGVLSYGPLAVVNGGGCNTDSDCAPPFDCYRPTAAAGTCQRVEPGLWAAASVCTNDFAFQGVSAAGCGVDAVVDGTRSGFSDDAARDVLPINIDVGALGNALGDFTVNELGAVVGVPAAGRFNGVIYITSRFNGALPGLVQTGGGVGPASVCGHANGSSPSLASCPGASSNAVHKPRSVNRIPLGLCGAGANLTAGAFNGVESCASASRPNAVRVFNASRVPTNAFPRGLTIATDLPLYIYGDVNRVTNPPTPQVKVAFVADRITFLSRGWRDGEHPLNDVAAGAPTATGRMIVEASLISGLPERAGGVHDVADIFRTPQVWSDNNFILRGHLIGAFNSVHDTRTVSAHRVNNGLRWLPDYHLENPGFQPPGLPLLPTPPSARWRQR